MRQTGALARRYNGLLIEGATGFSASLRGVLSKASLTSFFGLAQRRGLITQSFVGGKRVEIRLFFLLRWGRNCNLTLTLPGVCFIF